MPDLPFDQIQGFVLRGYTHPRARHFMIGIPNAAAGRKFVAAVTPMITTAVPWSVKPPTCYNIAFTADGLSALGINVTGAGFSTEFVEGAIQRGMSQTSPQFDLGDHGTSAPADWILSLGTGAVHIILTLFALDPQSRDDGTTVIESMMTSAGVQDLGHQDSDDILGDSRIHFGYHDSISQPNIDGAPPRKIQDNQPVVSTGEFVLGYNAEDANFRAGPSFDPANGTYSAFRILKQDVDAFYEYLAAAASTYDLPQEVIQAKFCGRWADGTPLVLSPDTPDPSVPLNDFDYSKDVPARSCPIASHIRRSQRRNEDTQQHRILRRAAPYGPPYVPKDGEERGLTGHFICSSLQQQYEFIVSQWVNGSGVTGLARDPLLGAIDDTTPPQFRMYSKGEKTTLAGFGRFTTTRGGAYCYLPSIAGLHALST
jgi:deferrochelatase/peroxidase EfeB